MFSQHFGKFSGNDEKDDKIYMVIILLPMLALCSIRNLKHLAPISMLANMLQMAGLGMTFFYLLKDLPPTWDRKPFATWWVLSVHTIKRQFRINIYVMFSGANCLYTSGQPFMPSRVLVWFFLWRIRCGSHVLSEAGQVSSTPAWSLSPACTLPSGSLAT